MNGKNATTKDAESGNGESPADAQTRIPPLAADKPEADWIGLPSSTVRDWFVQKGMIANSRFGFEAAKRDCPAVGAQPSGVEYRVELRRLKRGLWEVFYGASLDAALGQVLSWLRVWNSVGQSGLDLRISKVADLYVIESDSGVANHPPLRFSNANLAEVVYKAIEAARRKRLARQRDND